MTLSFTVVGEEEVARKLGNLSKKMTVVVQGVLHNAGLLVEGQAKLFCPVLTGRLRSNLHTTTKGMESVVGTNVEYGPAVEFGTSRQRSQPYLRPALNNNKRKIMGMVEGVIKKVVK